jgi:hypothetical protein
MGFGCNLSRRTLLQAWLASLGRFWASGGKLSATLDPVSVALQGFAPAVTFQRRYRMDATILLLGATIFTRKAAGGAYASVEISRDTMAVALQFAAGSSPARAHGLNRFGILREAIVRRETSGDASEISFAGLMTRAREESFEQGRKALASPPGGSECVVARGRTSASGVQTWIDTADIGPESNWTNLNETLGEALRHEPRTTPRETSAGSASTFLHAMHDAALCPDARVQRLFLHGGKLYWLETRRQPQRTAEGGVELAGTIHNLNGARCAEFRTAYLAGDESGIPVRIEYRPRSFLRLSFEAEPEATQPAIHSLFPEALLQEAVAHKEVGEKTPKPLPYGHGSNEPSLIRKSLDEPRVSSGA